jgi:hypothetical protein
MSNAYNIHRQPMSSSSGAPAQAPMSVVAIIGLVAPFVCLWPVGLICSIVGLVQTKDGAKRGRGIAIAGVVVNGLFALFSIGMFIASPSELPTGPVRAEDVTTENAKEMADALEREVDNDG